MKKRRSTCPGVVERLVRWGVRHKLKVKGKPPTEAVRVVLSHRMKHHDESCDDIASRLKIPEPSLRYWVQKLGLAKHRPAFDDFVLSKGFASVPDFFKDPKIAAKTNRSLAKETGFSYVTISKHRSSAFGPKEVRK